MKDKFNDTIQEIDKRFFPDVIWHHDNPKCAKAHYELECFNNGVTNLTDTVKRIAKLCNTDEATIEEIIIKNYEL